MTSHRKETDTLPVILGQHLPTVGAKVMEHGERRGKEMGKTLVSDGPEPQTQRSGFCVLGREKTRHRVKRPGLRLALQQASYAPGANKVSRYGFKYVYTI